MSTNPAMRERLDARSRSWKPSSRVVLLLTGLLVLVMPITEYLWHFDNFLHGGQDLELGLFSIAMVVCLILVLVQRTGRAFSLMLGVRILAIRERISILCRDLNASVFSLPSQRTSAFREVQGASLALSLRAFPIRV